MFVRIDSTHCSSNAKPTFLNVENIERVQVGDFQILIWMKNGRQIYTIEDKGRMALFCADLGIRVLPPLEVQTCTPA